ncbi:DUF1272 domain-containing protein [Vibrio sp.]|nr:DUF1272 domain-containing protein [Vibrio sp.]
MLELKPNCECCDKDLPPDSTEAMICSFECTFCEDCVEHILENVCPNCGGGLTPRPIRPKIARRIGVSLTERPASNKRVVTNYTIEEIKLFAANVKHIKPQER